MSVVSTALRLVLSAVSKRKTYGASIDNRAEGEEYGRMVARRLGFGTVTVVKVRHDTKCVLFAEHPEYGDVVLKTLVPTYKYADASAQQHVRETVRARQHSGILPAIYDHGIDYVIEERVRGREVEQLGPAEIARVDASSGFGWLEGVVLDPEAGSTLHPVLTLQIVRRQAKKILAGLNRPGGAHAWRHLPRLPHLYRAINVEVERLAASTRAVVLPQTLMVGDLCADNLLVDAEGRLRIIDYEFASMGHYGFDVAYLAATIAAVKNNDEAVAKAWFDALFDLDTFESEAVRLYFYEVFLGLTRLKRLVRQGTGVSWEPPALPHRKASVPA